MCLFTQILVQLCGLNYGHKWSLIFLDMGHMAVEADEKMSSLIFAAGHNSYLGSSGQSEIDICLKTEIDI